MNAEARRQAIVKHLSQATAPVSATVLANLFSVSRQVIVGDIALLRAAGSEITATPRGYVINQYRSGLTKTIACVHPQERTEEELNIFVDNGCIVEDVVVEHPIYGQITGLLHIASRYDVQQFIARMQETEGATLSTLTGGIHLHNVRCPDEETYERTYEALLKAGFIPKGE